jgi:hypothetical protein
MPKKIKDKIRVNLHSPYQKDRVPQLLRADGVNKLIRNVFLKNRKLLSLKKKKDQQVEIFESNLSRVNYQKISPLKPLQTRVKAGNSQLNKIELV